MPKKLSRYHRDVFFPTWAESSMEEFIRQVKSNNTLSFSIHSVDKIVTESFEYGRQLFKFLLKSIRKTSFGTDSIFEFYSVGEEIKKACFRFSFEQFPVDIILVISSDGTVITMYTTNKGDNHNTLDSRLYERR